MQPFWVFKFGTKFAFSYRWMRFGIVGLGWILMLSGCVTRGFDYELSPNFPAVIRPTSQTPLNQLIRLEPSSQVFSSFEVQVDVTDADDEEFLQYRFVLDERCIEDGVVFMSDESSTGDLTEFVEGTITETFPRALLAPDSCERLELLVSRAFLNTDACSSSGTSDPRATAELGDLTQTVWWVMNKTTVGSTIDMEACP